MDDKIFKAIDEEVTKWYGDRLPSITSRSFSEFSSKVRTLIENMPHMGRRLAPEKYVVRNAPTASFNILERKVTLPSWYFSEEVIRKAFDLEHDSPNDIAKVAISLINGSSIHEGMHAVFTTIPFEKAHEIPEVKVWIDKFPAFFDLLNVCEDIMNEWVYTQARTHSTRWIGKLIQNKNEILIPFDNGLEYMSHLAEGEMPTPQHWMSLMVSMKNFRFATYALRQGKSDRLQQVMDLLYSTANKVSGALSSYSTETTREDMCKLRYKAAARVAEILFGEFDDDELKKVKASSDPGDGEGAEGSESLDGEKADGEGESEATASGDGDESDGDEEATSNEGDLASIDKDLIEKIAKALAELEDEAYERMELLRKEFEKEINEEKGTVNRIERIEGKTVEVDIENFKSLKRSKPSYKPTRFNWDKFVRLLVALRAFKTTPGPQRDRGSRINGAMINRIVTDGKVFSTPTTTKKRDVDVSLLVDASGSMGERYLDCLEAAKHLARGLTKARVTNSVYAHTSTEGPIHGEDIPLLTSIWKGGKGGYPLSKLENRFNRASRLYLSQNYDGIAIDRVAGKMLKNRNSNKVLIVLSDGLPAGVGYSGFEANNHTIRAIQNARKAGVKVICLSLVSDVVAANSKLYGKENNVDCSVNFVENAKRVITNIL